MPSPRLILRERLSTLALAAGVCLVLARGASTQAALTRLDVLHRAYEIAKTIPSADQQAATLADVGLALRELDPEKSTQALNEAVFTAASNPSQVGQALAQQAVARRLQQVDPQRAEGLFQSAIRTADQLHHPAQKALIYTEVACSRAGAAKDAALDLMAKAAEQARAVPELGARVGTLQDVSKAYEPLDPATADALFREAVKVAQGAPPGPERDLALAELVGFIARRSIQEAVQVAGGIADPAAKSEALTELVRAIAPREPPQALELALSAPDPATRIAALADLSLAVGASAPEIARTAAAKAAEAANALPEDDAGHEARAAAAVARAPVDLTEALAAARKIGDPYFVDTALSRIALFLVPSNLDRALSVTLEIERGVLQSDPLCAVIDRLAERDPKQAYDLSAKIRARDKRVQALLTIASHLPEKPGAG